MRKVSINETLDRGKLFTGFFMMMFLAGLLTILCDGYDFNVFGVIVPPLMKDWHLSPTVTGLLGSYGLFGMLVGAIGLGMLADRIGRKKTILIGIATYAFFNGLTGFAQSPAAFGIFRFIGGLGLGGVMPSVVALLSEYSPAGHRAMMIAMSFSGVQVGAIAASGLGIALLPQSSWRILFWVAFIPLILVPIFGKILPESAEIYLARNDKDSIRKILQKADPEFVPREDDEYIITTPKAKKVSALGLIQEKRAFGTIMFFIVYFMNLFMIFSITTWLPKLMINKGYTLASSLVMLLIFNVGSIAASLALARVADLWGCKRCLVGLYLLCFVCISLVGVQSNYIALLVLIALCGCGVNAGMNIAHAYVSQSYPVALRSSALGWALGVGRVGAMVAPTFGGILLAAHASVPTIFLAFGIPGLIAAIAVGLTRQPEAVSGSVGMAAFGK